MPIESNPLYKLDPHLAKSIQSKSLDLFAPREGHPQLELSLVYRTQQADEEWVLQAKPKLAVNRVADLRRLDTVSRPNYSRVELY